MFIKFCGNICILLLPTHSFPKSLLIYQQSEIMCEQIILVCTPNRILYLLSQPPSPKQINLTPKLFNKTNIGLPSCWLKIKVRPFRLVGTRKEYYCRYNIDRKSRFEACTPNRLLRWAKIFLESEIVIEKYQSGRRKFALVTKRARF